MDPYEIAHPKNMTLLFILNDGSRCQISGSFIVASHPRGEREKGAIFRSYSFSTVFFKRLPRFQEIGGGQINFNTTTPRSPRLPPLCHS